MDAMERSHTFESAVVSSLFNARQMIWTELSSVISDIKERFDRSNKERNTELNRLLSENHSLSDLLKRLREIVEGKQLEINGLRRQLQGFYTGRPICSSCSRSVDPIIETGKTPIGSDEDKISDLRPDRLYQSHTHALNDARKRDRYNASLSSEVTETNEIDCPTGKAIPPMGNTTQILRSRHSQKRQCVRTPLDALTPLSVVLVRDTEAFDDTEVDDSQLASDVTPTNASSNRKNSDSERNDPVDNPLSVDPARDSPGTPTEPQLGISKLSPPTQSYDASLAIENAVNHLDLANYENTVLESIQSQTTTQPNQDSSGCDHRFMKVSAHVSTMSRLLVRRNSGTRSVLSRPMNRRFALSMEPFRPQHQHHNHHHAADRISERRHKATCRHARQSINNEKPVGWVEPRPKDVEPGKVPKSLDDTGADLSLPSDFLESERSELAHPVQPTSTAPKEPCSKPTGRNSPDLDELLPSLGGSPTRDAQVFKRPNGPAPHSQCNPQSSPRRMSAATAQSTQLPSQSDNLKTQLSDQPPEFTNIQTSLPADKPRIENTRRRTVKYAGPVVRRHSVRREMPAHACKQCKEYYESMGLSSPEIASRLHRCSRHRTIHGPPPSTPKGFWDLDISDCEVSRDLPEYEAKDQNRQSLRRRRTLKSTSGPGESQQSTTNSA